MGNSRVFNPGIRRRVLSGAASLIALAVFGAAGVARAETLSVAEVVSRAAAKNPSLRAALLDARAAHAAAEAERGIRAWWRRCNPSTPRPSPGPVSLAWAAAQTPRRVRSRTA